MANLQDYYIQSVNASAYFRETAATDLAILDGTISLLGSSLQSTTALGAESFTSSLSNGLNASLESVQALSELFQNGFSFDLTPLGEEGLLGKIDLLTGGIEPLDLFFGTLRDQSSQSANWIGFSGETLLGGLGILLGKESEKSTALQGLLGSRETSLSEAYASESGMALLAQEEKLGLLAGFLGTSFALQEQGLMAQQGVLTGFLNGNLGLIYSAATEAFGMKTASANDQIMLETESQTAQNDVTAAGFDEKMNMAANLLGGLASLMKSESKEAFMVGKTAAIAEAGISMTLGAMKAFQSLASIPIVGPGLGAIAAASVIVSGAKSINDIRSQQFSGGGGKPKANYKPISAKQLSGSSMKASSLPAVAGLPISSGAGGGTAAHGMAGGADETRIKVLINGKAILNTLASPSAGNPLILEARAA